MSVYVFLFKNNDKNINTLLLVLRKEIYFTFGLNMKW